MLEDRDSLVLYTTAVCNLNCRYCFIDKNPALKQIDDCLDGSFLASPDYYFEFAKKMFLQHKLEEVQFWGGEPFLGMHRAYPTVEKLIGYYPNLKKFLVSTNFVSTCFFEEFFGLINVLNNHPDRHFEFSL
jgi:sulfatase maturation enzyme AslB (radical SAM superfamily)